MTFWFGFESGVMATVFLELVFLAALLVAGVRARRPADPLPRPVKTPDWAPPRPQP